ncbi:unnamed protein product [Schistocephalus solidus]|uniref:Mitochondrial import inner membrane translocase subunit TIM16 n=1 Tax=Schistocephalus solidus TaxID=70667 RepID=A0A183T5J2_SCHSO|nr:unnamed protein product [Schistocephalus solidus]
MEAKYVAQILLAGSRILGRAFAKALQEEYAASQQAAKARASSRANDSSTSRNGGSFTDSVSGISLEEAKQILNIQDIRNAEELQKKFDHLFSVNAKSKGGSLYLQSKVSTRYSFLPLIQRNHLSFCFDARHLLHSWQVRDSCYYHGHVFLGNLSQHIFDDNGTRSGSSCPQSLNRPVEASYFAQLHLPISLHMLAIFVHAALHWYPKYYHYQVLAAK